MEYIIPVAFIHGIVFGFICALVANKRGHSGRMGFLWGLFFGIFGLIFVIIEKDSELLTQRKEIALGKMKTCYCGNVITTNSTICPVCGKDISQVLPSLEFFNKFHSQPQLTLSQKILAFTCLIIGLITIFLIPFSFFVSQMIGFDTTVFLFLMLCLCIFITGFLAQLNPPQSRIHSAATPKILILAKICMILSIIIFLLIAFVCLLLMACDHFGCRI